MPRTILLLAAVLLLGASAASAKGGFPTTIALPEGFAPEGIEIEGKTAYVGSVGTGAVWAGDLRTGKGDVLVPGAAGRRSATGIEYDRGRLWVSGASFGNVLLYDARSGALLQRIQLATITGATFVNDAVATEQAVWLTDSQRPVLYKVALSHHGAPGAVTTVPLSGDYQHVSGFNLNGIVATPNGKTLIAVQSAAKKLYAIDTDTGAAKLIDLGGYDLANGDGLLLKGHTLYVVQNQLDRVAVFELSKKLATATFVTLLTNDELDVPTTIDRAGKRLYVVNARFGRPSPVDDKEDIVRLR